MSIDAVKATTSDVNSSGDFSLSEWLKKVKDGMKKWANFDEQKQRGSLVGKVFTGGYVLIFGWLFFHSLICFWDIILPFNIALSTYFYYYGAYVVSVLISGAMFLFLAAMMVREGLSDDDGIRYPLNAGVGFLIGGLILSNMAGEPYPDLKQGWFGSDLRYPEFMSYGRFYFVLTTFLSDMGKAFGSVDDDSSVTFMFRPLRKQKLNDKQRVYDENLSGLLGVALIYFSYWYFIFALIDNAIEGFAYYYGIQFIRDVFGRGYKFESARKSLMFNLITVPILAAVQGYYSYQRWRSYGSDNVFYAESILLSLHFILYAGWYCRQDSWLGRLCLPYTRKVGFEDFNFEGEDFDYDEDEKGVENKKTGEDE